MPDKLEPTMVMPVALARAVRDLTYWFVIGGHAVRCYCPYRPTRDVDFGVRDPKNLDDLLQQLNRSGTVEVLERGRETLHLRWNGINVSIFVLNELASFVEDRSLDVTGIMATKLHAILNRGARRDFFDLYVTLHRHRLGLSECLAAMRKVYGSSINDGLLLRALTYFDDADREAELPGEGPKDWGTVKDFFLKRVGQLLVPPTRSLVIEKLRVDVNSD